MNDEIIIEKLINQDQSGLSLIIDNYGGLISYIVKNTIHPSEEDLKECISDILLTIWKRILKYNPEKSSFKSWLVMVSRGCSVDYLRKYKRHNHIPLEDMSCQLFYEMTDLSVTKIIDMMQMMSPPDNEIFYLRFVMGEEVESISNRLNLSKENTYKRITRGKDKFRTIMKKEGYHV
ncbi:MAG: sigma-70 family RNA polymerase sigma factor [Clostridiales bacterium]|nr:sigma-70 family RNA polymerase sigma factor [Clostridiales bacterium]